MVLHLTNLINPCTSYMLFCNICSMLVCTFLFSSCLNIVYSIYLIVIFGSLTVRLPLFFDPEQPEKKGLPGTRNFFLETDKNVKVGVW